MYCVLPLWFHFLFSLLYYQRQSQGLTNLLYHTVQDEIKGKEIT